MPQWVPPPATKEKHNFAELKSIDLSLLDSDDSAVVDELIQKVKLAIRNDGFLFLENYGISLEQVRLKSQSRIVRIQHTNRLHFAASPSILSCSVSIQQHQQRRQGTPSFPP